MEHDNPLITYGFCEDSPEIKPFINKIKNKIGNMIEKIIIEKGYNREILLIELFNYINKLKETE